jgi:hypothetical protein
MPGIEFRYLGEGQQVPDRRTPVYQIAYNDGGFSEPINWAKRSKKLIRKGVPEAVVLKLREAWGDDPAPIGDWIDRAWEMTRNAFLACPGSVRDKAERVTPARLTRVVIMPSVFPVPNSTSGYTAGAFYPDSRIIKVVNIYPNGDWIRHAKDLLTWECGNFYSLECGIKPEDSDGPGGRPAGWPCLK